MTAFGVKRIVCTREPWVRFQRPTANRFNLFEVVGGDERDVSNKLKLRIRLLKPAISRNSRVSEGEFRLDRMNIVGVQALACSRGVRQP